MFNFFPHSTASGLGGIFGDDYVTNRNTILHVPFYFVVEDTRIKICNHFTLKWMIASAAYWSNCAILESVYIIIPIRGVDILIFLVTQYLRK